MQEERARTRLLRDFFFPKLGGEQWQNKDSTTSNLVLRCLPYYYSPSPVNSSIRRRVEFCKESLGSQTLLWIVFCRRKVYLLARSCSVLTTSEPTRDCIARIKKSIMLISDNNNNNNIDVCVHKWQEQWLGTLLIVLLWTHSLALNLTYLPGLTCGLGRIEHLAQSLLTWMVN